MSSHGFDWNELWKLLGIGGGVGGAYHAAKALRHILRVEPTKLTACKVEIRRDGRGWLWNRQVAVHAAKDGKISLTAIKSP